MTLSEGSIPAHGAEVNNHFATSQEQRTVNSDLTSPIEFDSPEPIIVPVTYKGKRYVLKEASEAAAVAYRNAQLKGARYDKDGNPIGNVSIAEAEPVLVQHCVFEVYGSDDRQRPVLMSQVLDWHPKFVRQLFERVKAISQIDDDVTEETILAQIGRLQSMLERIRAGKEQPETAAEASAKN